ncbi:hypothetical protein M422DRAFT_263100 [Sphaerobolus stellatus SS14]|uniref:Uncharacterized protein n=1 Tax=Sphaerobolus stellatus (strain SS14) TaxID=990650 RepID=A0A0C9VB73_SPHS4|nr:hypothetical protein M422DRAFT_263100 [Sphaerobolus stellatus SS14]
MAQNLIKNSEIALDLDFRWLPLPCTRGYLRSHKYADYAIKCIERSRDAFLGLLATISLGILLFKRFTPKPDMSSPWIDYLCAHKGLDCAWVEDLARTFVGDFSPQILRQGTFIDVKQFSSFEILREFLKVNIPIWYCWGPTGNKLQPTHWAIIDIHMPPTTHFNEILTYYTKPISTYAHPCHSLVPHWSSQQLLNESWQEFFNRLEIRLQLVRSIEDEASREARLNRERYTLLPFDPDSAHLFGIKVFAWLKFKDGRRVRTQLNGGELRWRWEMYSATSRRYNSFDDEWDLCSEFDEDYDNQASSPHNGDSDNEASFKPVSFEEDFINTQEDYEIALGTFNEVLRSENDIYVPQDISIICYNRYGLKQDPEGQDNSVQVDITKMPIGAALCVLTERGCLINHNLDRYFQAFVLYVLQDIPLPALVSNFSLDGLNKELIINVWDPSTFITCKKTSKGIIYVLSGSHKLKSSRKWFIATYDPLQAFRWSRFQHTTGLLNILGQTLHEGSPSYIIYEKKALNTDIEDLVLDYPYPAYKFLDHIPTRTEYISYLYRRQQFLRSPRGPLALYEGGIIWRLARETLQEDEAVALPEHDESVFSYDKQVLFSITQSEEYATSRLTDKEIDIVCGVYSVNEGGV